MDFKRHLEKAWNLTTGNLLSLILMTLVMFVVSFVTLGILAPVTMAGYMHAVLLLVRSGREPKVQDLFSEMRLFFPLLGFSILVFLATLIGFILLVLPGVVVILAVCVFCLYLIPLMTDRRLGLIEAIKESCAMSVGGNFLEHIVVAIIFFGISAVGQSVFVGWLFTQPLATVFLLAVYEEKRGDQ
jgi:hypothetical protein